MNQYSSVSLIVWLGCMVLLSVSSALANPSAAFSQSYYSLPNCTGPATGPEGSQAGACYQGRFDFNFYCSADGLYGYALEYAENSFQCASDNIISVQQIPLGCIGGVLTQCANATFGPFMPTAFPPSEKSFALQTDCTSLGVDTCTSPAGAYHQNCTTTAWNSGACTLGDEIYGGESSAFFCSANGEWAGWLTSTDQDSCQKGNYSSAILHHTECMSGMQFQCADVAPTMPAPPNAAMLIFQGNGCDVSNSSTVFLSHPNECGAFGTADFTQQLICNANGTITVNWWSDYDSSCPQQPMSTTQVQDGTCVNNIGYRAICNAPAGEKCSAIFSCAFGKDWEMSRELKKEDGSFISSA